MRYFPYSDRWVTLASAAIFCTLAASYFHFVADDAYIVGRYAQNAARGIGLVYNEGDFVSALTSPLHALIESVFAWLGLDPVAAYRILAPVFLLTSLLVSAGILGHRGNARAVYLFFTLTSPFLALWSVGGLETPLLTGLMAVFFAVVFRILRDDSVTSGQFILLGLIAGLSFVTRYDSIIVVAPVLAVLTLLHFRRVALWLGGLVALTLAGGWLGFAQAYYAEILPTSAFVKLGRGSEPLELHFINLVNFLVMSGLLLLLPLARIGWPENRHSRSIGVGVVVALVLFFVYALQASAQHMMFSYRFFVPYLPLFGMVLALAVEARSGLVASLALLVNLAVAPMIPLWGLNPGSCLICPSAAVSLLNCAA